MCDGVSGHTERHIPAHRDRVPGALFLGARSMRLYDAHRCCKRCGRTSLRPPCRARAADHRPELHHRTSTLAVNRGIVRLGRPVQRFLPGLPSVRCRCLMSVHRQSNRCIQPLLICACDPIWARFTLSGLQPMEPHHGPAHPGARALNPDQPGLGRGRSHLRLGPRTVCSDSVGKKRGGKGTML